LTPPSARLKFRDQEPDLPHFTVQHLPWSIDLASLEIDDDDGIVFADEDVLWPDVAVADFAGVELLEGFEDVVGYGGGVGDLVEHGGLLLAVA